MPIIQSNVVDESIQEEIEIDDDNLELIDQIWKCDKCSFSNLISQKNCLMCMYLPTEQEF